ncbi:MAG: H(+)/Cl(-) exchange transporter ClcA [Gammaproteobacteria bacterium]|jgi:H+/Cl- antiporter ClcA|nr:H(+)/Cl(-) exchange transporter ClcA [Gammaproteobacteria bacterium]
MKPPWQLYVAATLVGAFAGLVGAAFHALLEQSTAGRAMLHPYLESWPLPGWLVVMAAGALVLVTALWLVRRFAPETAGSGVQEVEAILAGERALRWRRVLPVKFVAGTLAVGSGLVLGREGPTIHLGAALGQLASERPGLRRGDQRALIAAGAAAGLATAFNAPLAAIVFVTEELREHFEYRFATIQSVILACCASVVVSGWLLGQGPDMPMPDLEQAPLQTAPLFLILGLLIGALGVLFNRLVLGSVSAFRALGAPRAYFATALSGMILGALLWFAPATVGGGEHLVESLLHGHPGLLFLLGLLAVRLLTTVGSYGLGLPGGVFAPMLALGTLCGAAFALVVEGLAPALALEPAVFAVAAMGALFAATVRAPLTGIILVIELTDAQALALPIILTCLAATFTAEGLGGRPIYSALLGLSGEVPPRKPVRRIAVGAAVLAGFIGIEQLDVRWQGTDVAPVRPIADASSTLPSLSKPRPQIAKSLDPLPPLAPTPPAVATGMETALPEQQPTAPGTPRPVLRKPQTRDDQDQTTAVGSSPGVDSGTGASATRPSDTQPRYSIQLISFRDQRSLLRFAEQQGLIGEAQTLTKGSPSQRWHAVLIGSYASREAASDALQRLPARLRRLDPMVRTLDPNAELMPIEAPTTR